MENNKKSKVQSSSKSNKLGTKKIEKKQLKPCVKITLDGIIASMKKEEKKHTLFMQKKIVELLLKWQDEYCYDGLNYHNIEISDEKILQARKIEEDPTSQECSLKNNENREYSKTNFLIIIQSLRLMDFISTLEEILDDHFGLNSGFDSVLQRMEWSEKSNYPEFIEVNQRLNSIITVLCFNIKFPGANMREYVGKSNYEMECFLLSVYIRFSNYEILGYDTDSENYVLRSIVMRDELNKLCKDEETGEKYFKNVIKHPFTPEHLHVNLRDISSYFQKNIK